MVVVFPEVSCDRSADPGVHSTEIVRLDPRGDVAGRPVRVLVQPAQPAESAPHVPFERTQRPAREHPARDLVAPQVRKGRRDAALLEEIALGEEVQ